MTADYSINIKEQKKVQHNKHPGPPLPGFTFNLLKSHKNSYLKPFYKKKKNCDVDL